MAAGRKDYCKLLGVGRNADEKTIKSAYRRLALKYHPDVAQGKRAAGRFREIQEAYTVLSNAEARALRPYVGCRPRPRSACRLPEA